MAFCPPTSLAARYTALPPFDLSVGGDGGGGGGGGGGGSGSVVFGTSPLTPTRLWDEHIQEISRELEVICGSPRNRTKDRSSRPPPPPPLTQHLSMGCLLKASASASSLKCPPGAVVVAAASRAQRLFRVESQDRVQMVVEPPIGFCLGYELAPVFRHRLTVRHEETRSKLNRQLALVCPIKSDEIPAKRPSDKYCEHRHSDSHIVRRQMSSKSGVLYKVPLDQRKSEELFVSFLDDHVLRVCADDAAKEDEELVEEVSVPTEVPVQSLVLSVFDGRWLYIQQRTTEDAMVLDFVGTSGKYLPIIHENEASLQLEISLRIPAEFDADEVTVKTIDDRVFVSGSKRPITSAVLGGSEDGVSGGGGGPVSPPLTVGHAWTPPSAVCFVVILPLPSGTQSRSVSAYFSRPHHLVITGRLYPTRRRSTI